MSRKILRKDRVMLNNISNQNISFGENTNIYKEKQNFEKTFRITMGQTKAFIEATGDNNPIHTKGGIITKDNPKGLPIVHGMHLASVFSNIFGTQFPGDGTFYMQQSATWKKPAFHDTEYRAEAIVKEIPVNKEDHPGGKFKAGDPMGTAILETNIYDTKGTPDKTDDVLIMEGEAAIMNRKRITLGTKD